MKLKIEKIIRKLKSIPKEKIIGGRAYRYKTGES